MKNFKVGRVDVNNDSCVIIAEAGVNHLSDMALAERLIKEAAKAGADIIKFQTYKAEKLVSRDAPRFWDWQGEEKPDGTQYDSYSRLDKFGRPEHAQLVRLCEQYGIQFMSTPFDADSAKMLHDIGCPAFKVASCDINNLPFLQELAEFGMPIFLSTGAANIQEIREAVAVLESGGVRDICIMHCTLCYPTAIGDVNLLAINDIKTHFPDYIIGFSDHTLGWSVPITAIPLGVRVIEKHYTVDKSLPDSADHWLSLDPVELADLCRLSAEVMESLGDGIKRKLACEQATFDYARRSVVVSRPIKKGQIIKREDITCKRPGTGLPPRLLPYFIDRTAARDLSADRLLTLDDVL